MKLTKNQLLGAASLLRENSSRIKLMGRGLTPYEISDLQDQIDREAILAPEPAKPSPILRFAAPPAQPKTGIAGTLDGLPTPPRARKA